MPTSIEELNAFHHFAIARIGNGCVKLSLAELVELWELEHPIDGEQQEVHDALDRATAELDAGAGRPTAEFNAELRAQYAFANR